MNNQNAIEYIKNNSLIGIKAGNKRDSFLEIWMVIVDGRVFARSWGLATRSWYNAFKEDNTGEILCGEAIHKIKAIVPDDIEALTKQINKAYLDKYDYGSNSYYANGIIEEKHAIKTMEFIIE